MHDIRLDEAVPAMIAAAVRAPSSHNSQPWRFRHDGNRVALYADRTRALPVTDPDDRELTISCGAALYNLEIAAAGQGYLPRVALVPDPHDRDLLAVVDLEPGGASPVIDHVTAGVRVRRTTRGRFGAGSVPEGLAPRLRRTAEQHQVGWHEVGAGARAALAALVAEADRIQFADPAWRRELAAWMPSRARADGLRTPPVIGGLTRAAVRGVGLGRPTARRDRRLTTRAPLVVVLTTGADTTGSWLATGRALAHVLAAAAAEGVHAGFLNQPCQVPRLRHRLSQLCETSDHPQLVLRLGPLPVASPSSARRPVSEVLD